MSGWIVYLIVLTGILNLFRMATYLISSDVYNFQNLRKKKERDPRYMPLVSVLVPAYNESATIERTVSSLLKSNYPKSKLEIIVVNDGSTDKTPSIVRRLIRKNTSGFKLKLINQKNSGKAAALNSGIKQFANGRIIMCLDADSMVGPDSIRNGVQYFRDRQVVSVASNVNIIEDGTLFGLAQRFEYLVCYQMKKAQTTLKVEYIIGGIGSMFRRTAIERVGYYDSNTMTEDIDLTMKVIAHGNRNQKLVFADDCLTYTESVHSMKALMRQRYRWKYGRMQTFLKHPQLFFSHSGKYRKRLTWLMLPYALLQDALFFVEPLAIGFILYASLRYQDSVTLLCALIIISSYILINVWDTQHLDTKEKLRLTYYAPSMYILMYLLSFAEYAALIKSCWYLPKLKSSINENHIRWQSPERRAAASSQ